VNYWGNYPKFFVSLMKAFYGDKATAENSWGFDWLPKWDKGYDVLQYFEMMNQGKVNGYLCQGFNPVASFPNKNKVVASLSKLKFLVTIDPLNTETSTFWQNHGESNDVDPSKIQTEVFRLPSTCFAEENGSIVNSGRWLQWHWKGADAPGIALNDGEILAGIFLRLRKMYTAEGGACPEQVLNMSWNYSTPENPAPEEVAMESNGKALADVIDPATGTVLAKKGEQLSTFAHLRDDGTTSSGCWIFAGSWTPKGNQMANRDNADPSGLGNTLGWAWAWPLNRRILYNRASADPQGNPWDPKRQLLKWDGAKWGGVDIPDYSTAAPGSDVGEHALSTTLFQGFCRFAQGAAGVDHVVNQHAVAASNVTDDVHHLRNVSTRTALVDDSHVGVVQQFSDSTCANHAADVRRNHDRVVQVQLQHVFEQDRAAEYVINRNVEEALDLLCVQVNRQNAVNAYAGQEVSDNFSSDWHTRGTDATVLAGVAKVRNNSRDTACGSTAQGIDHNNQFHQVVVSWSTGGLDDENITTAYIFVNLYADFAVAKATYSGVAERSVQAVGNTLC
jgi:anaerobic selenocysteine-containing dehydrogenase